MDTSTRSSTDDEQLKNRWEKIETGTRKRDEKEERRRKRKEGRREKKKESGR